MRTRTSKLRCGCEYSIGEHEQWVKLCPAHEREWDETSHQRLVDTLGRLETGRGRVAEWRKLVAGGSSPRFDRPSPCGDRRLTGIQRLALSRALSALDYFLVHGPPGTGKTLVTRYVINATQGRTVLLLTGRGMGLISQSCAMARTLQPATVILEDVDLVAEERTRHDPG